MTASLERSGAQRRARRSFSAAFINPQDRALLQHIRQLTAQAHAQAPLFAPHIDSVLEFERLVGEGGMGTVHCVLDHRLGRRAAFKMIRRDQVSEDNIHRFARELLITARLSHPGIPPVYDAGMNADGDLFLLMRLIEGRSLDQVLKEEAPRSPVAARLRLREQVALLIRAAEAVAFAHGQGVLHRDLKPANIMVGDFGEVLILDWGLALDLSGQLPEEARSGLRNPTSLPTELAGSGLTQAGVVVGTLGYMAPEQARGEELDERADVFSLGAILTTILTGSPPLAMEGAVMDRLIATVKGRLKRPRDIAEGLPPELEAIAARATEAKRALRHRRVEDLIASLQAWLDGHEVPEYQRPPGERARRWIAGHPITMLSVLFTVLVLALAGFALGERGRARQAAASRQRFADSFELLVRARDLARRQRPIPEVSAAVERFLDKADPSEAVLIEAAQVYRERGAYSEAERLLKQAEQSFPPAFRALFARHKLETRGIPAGNIAGSSALNELCRRAPSDSADPYVIFARADAAAAAGDWSGAIALYDALERQAGAFPSLHNNRGICRYQLGDLEGAEADFDAALANSDLDYQAAINRSLVRFDRKRYQESLDDAERAVALNPRIAGAHFRRGSALYFLKQTKAALGAFDRCLELRPRDPKALANRALVRRSLGDAVGAREDYDEAVVHDPQNPKRYIDRADFLIRSGASDAEARAGLADLEKAIKELGAKSARAFALRGRARAGFGDIAGAIADFRRAQDLDPSNPRIEPAIRALESRRR